MNKNRIRGTAKQGERAKSREALVAKARRCISGGCAVKECVLTRGDLASCLKGRRGNTEREVSRSHSSCLIDRLKRRINDPGVIRLVRAYLNAGIMDGGVVMGRHEGTPQGGPLSPLLANVLLDEVDKELERRGHCFARYADDCNVYVRSHKAGERVMRLLRRCYAKLHLVINEAKSAVASVFGRKFLGYTLWRTRDGDVRRAVSTKALQAFKLRIRQLTRGSGGRSMAQVLEKLRSYLLGWKSAIHNVLTIAYFDRLGVPRLS